MKKIIATILLLALSATFILSGCGQKGDADLSGWEYIESKGKLVVGLDDTFAPMGFRDTDGNLVGLDIDLATEVGKILGVEIEFKPIVWNTKETALAQKTVDCLWNGMSATPERQEEMALTKKYLNNRIIIMALSDDVKVTSAADLQNYKIGTQAESAALEVMEANSDYDIFKDNILEYDTYDEALLALTSGRVDCIVVDEVLGEYKNSRLEEKMVVCDYNFGDDYYAIGCRKGETDLADKISDAIATLIENGKAKEISEKWLGRDLIILQ